MRSNAGQSRAARPMPPYTTSSPGRSATSGSRLFMSMRSGASVSQLFALSAVPRGARITPILSRRRETVMGRVFLPVSFPTAAQQPTGNALTLAIAMDSRSDLWSAGNDKQRAAKSRANVLQNCLQHPAQRRAGARRAAVVDRLRPVLGRGQVRLQHVAAAGELELDGLDAIGRLAVMADDPAALEAPVDDKSL